MVIFGATGDLTRRMLAPALYNLARERLLPLNFSVVGVARRPLDDAAFRRLLREGIDNHSRSGGVEAPIWESIVDNIEYLPVEFGDARGYRRLAERLAAIDRERGTAGNRIFYLATPPSAYPEIVENLGAAGLGRSPEGTGGETRIIVEKPFGHDLDSARRLNARIHRVFEERQVYRIDHYLGKETVQNILALRFANTLFEPVWNNRYVDSVQITVAETVGIGTRAGFYDAAGAARDVLQNHMLQLLALVAMEEPTSFAPDEIRAEKLKVLRAVTLPDDIATGTVRGQYQQGWISGRRVPGYREEPGVPPDSTTETYVAVRLGIQNRRWADVPFYLRTGKRLPRQVTELAVLFKPAPHLPFDPADVAMLGANQLVIRVQPDEGVVLKFGSKVPGTAMEVRDIAMDFQYGEAFTEASPAAYERLVLDVLLGDSTLFPHADEVEESWRVIDPLEEAWEGTEPEPYRAGEWGPPGAQRLLERDGRAWRRP
ncbi:MAG TPA: glucose-6-phosphate dehydrogenase [Natronosporangium sp.]